MIGVNFGCGPHQPEGWMNVDHKYEFHARYHVLEELEYMNGMVDVVVAHHVFQEITYKEQYDVLNQINKLLKDGGCLRITIPDILAGFDMYKKGAVDWFPKMNSEDIDGRFVHWLSWYNGNISPMTLPYLRKKLKATGFDRVEKSHYMETKSRFEDITKLDRRKGESIFLEAFKNG